MAQSCSFHQPSASARPVPVYCYALAFPMKSTTLGDQFVICSDPLAAIEADHEGRLIVRLLRKVKVGEPNELPPIDRPAPTRFTVGRPVRKPHSRLSLASRGAEFVRYLREFPLQKGQYFWPQPNRSPCQDVRSRTAPAEVQLAAK
jgi:hypothetical protein